MRRGWRWLAVLFLLVAIATVVCPRMTRTRTFVRVSEAWEVPDMFSGTFHSMIEGPSVSRGLARDMFPGIFAESGCSVTLVGRGVFIGAAHCFLNDRHFSIREGGQTAHVTCDYGTYRTGATAGDVAICTDDGTVAWSIQPECLDVETTTTPPEVLLTSAYYMQGAGKVEWATSGVASRSDGAFTLDGKTNYVVVGDSGGAVYDVTGNTRRIVAVIARTGANRQSRLADLAWADVGTYLRKALKGRKVRRFTGTTCAEGAL